MKILILFKQKVIINTFQQQVILFYRNILDYEFSYEGHSKSKELFNWVIEICFSSGQPDATVSCYSRVFIINS